MHRNNTPSELLYYPQMIFWQPFQIDLFLDLFFNMVSFDIFNLHSLGIWLFIDIHQSLLPGDHLFSSYPEAWWRWNTCQNIGVLLLEESNHPSDCITPSSKVLVSECILFLVNFKIQYQTIRTGKAKYLQSCRFWFPRYKLPYRVLAFEWNHLLIYTGLSQAGHIDSALLHSV